MLLPSAIIKLDIMLLLHNNLHESQSITDSLEPICNLHLCYNFAPMLHEITLVFSQSEACNFYMHIFKHCNNLVQVFYMPS